ncbi:ATPase, F0 complex, subunit E, mitochondrial [Kalmanozyma brasiliensis GHG001]|uniref:ATP synthase F(0) complex subunit e, mitochondrial n=1 Tax=Kalmanozyma brasiliensis (strain GHG001) TaxID=1365824 RepID=V5E566_KALBG|nr:ATPase, F0 complex, subunit E, mitochondrial [Kalmanozyma brasiliensis GHG001]EST05356.1 ATPase, F0 complex, subunit E, mitochondrial [Kalmanozyma brasiliensis GHG001]
MASSPVLNVVRYSALVGGIGYGILHRRTLQAKEDIKASHAAYKHKEHLIQKAKEAYKNRLVAQQSNSGIVTDPENPAFDLEKFLIKVEQENK